MSHPARWRRYRGAPLTGQTLLRLADMGDALTKAVTFTENGRDFPLLVVRRGGAVSVFVNACPHADLPLTYRSERVLSADGQRLMCSNHYAEFDALSGQGLDGLGAGCVLDRIPIDIAADGTLVVAEDVAVPT
jgi:nitrite reductase/ring-hydroxylating ferredoxin subunit